MLDMCNAPWDVDQVESLNAYQHCGYAHPFTGEYNVDGERFVLIATRDGWVEQESGPIVQTWAHPRMANWGWKHP